MHNWFFKFSWPHTQAFPLLITREGRPECEREEICLLLLYSLKSLLYVCSLLHKLLLHSHHFNCPFPSLLLQPFESQGIFSGLSVSGDPRPPRQSPRAARRSPRAAQKTAHSSRPHRREEPVVEEQGCVSGCWQFLEVKHLASKMPRWKRYQRY